MFFRPPLVLAAFASLVSCGEIPNVGGSDAVAARAAPYPELLPLETLINSARIQAPQITPASISDSNAQANQLRARANALRRPVVDAATRARMRAAIARAALR